MLVAALLDAGGDEELLRSLPGRLGLDGVGVEIERVDRQGLGALHVSFPAEGDPGDRDWSTIRQLLEGADLPTHIRTRSTAVFARLAEAEGRVHGVPTEDV